MRISEDIKLDFNNVLISPKRTTLASRAQVNLERTLEFKHAQKSWTGIPIMTSNMDTVGTLEMYKSLSELGLITCFHKFYNVNDYKNYQLQNGPLNPDRYMISTGIRDEDRERALEIVDELNPKFLCIDVANGYSTLFHDSVRKWRESNPELVLAGGNVVTYEMVEQLSIAGLDIIKVGLGNGSVCTTRFQTGVGYPQLSAVIECSDAAHGFKTHIISDGGVKTPGDVAKAFGAGADFVMSGSLFSGHEESAGETVELDGVRYKSYYGMSSTTAMLKHYGQVASHRSAEGKRELVKYKGPVKSTVLDILGGLRSTCTYINAQNIKDIPKCTHFIRVYSQQ